MQKLTKISLNYFKKLVYQFITEIIQLAIKNWNLNKDKEENLLQLQIIIKKNINLPKKNVADLIYSGNFKFYLL